jgi:hypothetical protein
MMYSNNPPQHGTDGNDTAMQPVAPRHIVIQKLDQLIQVKFVVLGGPHQHWMFLMNCFNTEGEMTGTNLRHKSIITSTMNSSDMFTYRNHWFTAIQSAAIALGWKTTKPMSKTEYTTMPLGALRLVVPTKTADDPSKVTRLVDKVVIPDKTQTQITTIMPPNDDTAGIVNNTKAYVDPNHDAKQKLRRQAGIRLPKGDSGNGGQENDMGDTEEVADATARAAGAAGGMNQDDAGAAGAAGAAGGREPQDEADMAEANTGNAGAGTAEENTGMGDADAGTADGTAGTGNAAATTAPRARRRIKLPNGSQPNVTGRVGGASAEPKRNFSDATNSDTEAGDDDDEQRTFTPSRPTTPPPAETAAGGKILMPKRKGKQSISDQGAESPLSHSPRPATSPQQPYVPGARGPGKRGSDDEGSDDEGYTSDGGTFYKLRRGEASNQVRPFRPPETPKKEAWSAEGDGGAVPDQGPPRNAYATLDLDDVLARLSLSI